MKYFLIFIIKIYWKLVPSHKRRVCIFKESCSNYVNRVTMEEGFIKGIKAFRNRAKKCKPGYKIINPFTEVMEVHLIDGSVITRGLISDNILNDLRKKLYKT